MLIFISGPLSSESRTVEESRVGAAMDMAIKLIARGHLPVVPHLTWYLDQRARQLYHTDIPREAWMALALTLLERCDAVFCVERLGASPGVRAELNHAEARGKEIYYDLRDVPFGPDLAQLPAPYQEE